MLGESNKGFQTNYECANDSRRKGIGRERTMNTWFFFLLYLLGIWMSDLNQYCQDLKCLHILFHEEATISC